MGQKTLFDEEETTIEQAKKILKDKRYTKNPLISEYKVLIDKYSKIYRQLRRLIRLSDKQHQNLVFELEQALESFIRTLVTTIEAKHKLTAGHTQRVTDYALFLGKKLKLTEDELVVLKYASLLHDIGKIAIPDAIITKRGRLTEDERNTMKEHPLWSFKILDQIPLPDYLKDVPTIAACHHEKIDGSGYPYGLEGEKIPLLSRILAVVDVFDTLTSHRDYPKYHDAEELTHDPLPMDRVFKILNDDRGSHFDARVVDTAITYRDGLEELWGQLEHDDLK